MDVALLVGLFFGESTNAPRPSAGCQEGPDPCRASESDGPKPWQNNYHNPLVLDILAVVEYGKGISKKTLARMVGALY